MNLSELPIKFNTCTSKIRHLSDYKNTVLYFLHLFTPDMTSSTHEI